MKKLFAIFLMLGFVGNLAFAENGNDSNLIEHKYEDIKSIPSDFNPDDIGKNFNGSQVGVHPPLDVDKNFNMTGNLTGTHTQNKMLNQLKVSTKQELKEFVQNKQQEMLQQFENKTEQSEKIIGQNQIRLAIQTILASENLTGGIGDQVSELAQGFNNSIQETIQHEEKIQNRNKLVKWFFGGDIEAAEELEEESNELQARIQNMNQLIQNSEMDEEIKEILQQQIQVMQQEQTRLQQLAQEEKGNNGIFGFLK